jgi:2-oxoglutarate dehydrogenase E2 component (dihydrolipoamide succinyltransferase)
MPLTEVIMPTQIVVPPMGESVSEATVAKWLKNVGDAVQMDEPLVELETDKVTLEVNAASSGIISEITAKQGSNVGVGAVLGIIQEGTASGSSPKVNAPAMPSSAAQKSPPANAASAAPPSNVQVPPVTQSGVSVMPAARKQADDRGINPYDVAGTGKNGRVTKEDVLNYATSPATPSAAAPQPSGPRTHSNEEERVKMTRLRQRIAERLKYAQNTSAMLTTFNEVDMTNVMALRNQHKEAFEKKYAAKLGFMSFFIKACILALREIPSVNAEIEGDDLVYKNYYDIGVAVGTPQGLVVPIVRDADKLNFAEIEKTISDLGKRAKDGKLSMADLTGGTFTITNGGIYGSLMSTPILNPPQSGILGMHAIKERPIVVNGKVEARPMMYLALTYDHRIIDGREAVTFLVRVKECVENPERLLLGV